MESLPTARKWFVQGMEAAHSPVKPRGPAALSLEGGAGRAFYDHSQVAGPSRALPAGSWLLGTTH